MGLIYEPRHEDGQQPAYECLDCGGARLFGRLWADCGRPFDDIEREGT